MLLWRQLLESLMNNNPSERLTGPQHDGLYEDVKQQFIREYLNRYDDIRWFFLRDAP
jgi:hypothetical protein